MAYQQLSLDQVTVAATGFKGPEGVTVDRDGNLYGGTAIFLCVTLEKLLS